MPITPCPPAGTAIAGMLRLLPATNSTPWFTSFACIWERFDACTTNHATPTSVDVWPGCAIRAAVLSAPYKVPSWNHAVMSRLSTGLTSPST